jgi:hypothetical protein
MASWKKSAKNALRFSGRPSSRSKRVASDQVSSSRQNGWRKAFNN